MLITIQLHLNQISINVQLNEPMTNLPLIRIRTSIRTNEKTSRVLLTRTSIM